MRSQRYAPTAGISVALTAILLALSVLLAACGGAPAEGAAPSAASEATAEPAPPPEPTPGPTPGPTPEPTPESDMVYVHAVVPESWQEPGAWAWADGHDVFDAWPGEPMEPDGDWYTIQIPAWTSYFIVNANGGSVQTADLSIDPGREVWIVVDSYGIASISYQEIEAPTPAPALTPEPGMVFAHVIVPEFWQEPCVRAWTDGHDVFDAWPDEPMEPDEDWFTFQIPAWASTLTVNANGGRVQTDDLSIEPGKEVWIVVREYGGSITVSYYPLDTPAPEPVPVPAPPPRSTSTIPPFARERIEFEDQISLGDILVLRYQTNDGEIKMIPVLVEYIVEDEDWYSNFYDIYTGDLILSAVVLYGSRIENEVVECFYEHPSLEDLVFLAPSELFKFFLEYPEGKYLSRDEMSRFASLYTACTGGAASNATFHTIEEYRQLYEDAFPERYRVDSYALFGDAGDAE